MLASKGEINDFESKIQHFKRKARNGLSMFEAKNLKMKALILQLNSLFGRGLFLKVSSQLWMEAQ